MGYSSVVFFDLSGVDWIVVCVVICSGWYLGYMVGFVMGCF